MSTKRTAASSSESKLLDPLLSLFFLTQDSQSLPYRDVKAKGTRVSFPGASRFFQALQFFTLFWEKERDDPEVNVVIVGPKEGYHYYLLSKFFPDFKFHVYDTKGFQFPKNMEKAREKLENFTVYNAGFDSSQAKIWSKKSNVYLILEISTFALDVNSNFSNENIRRQQEWLEIIKPKQALLTKVRLPYVEEKVTKSKGKGKGKSKTSVEDIPVLFFDGAVLKPIYSTQNNSVVGLVPMKDENGKYILRRWSSIEHQNRMFYFNQNEREKVVFQNVFTGEQESYNVNIDNSFDDSASMYVLKHYLYKMGRQWPNLEQTVSLHYGIFSELSKFAVSEISLENLKKHPLHHMDYTTVFKVKEKKPKKIEEKPKKIEEKSKKPEKKPKKLKEDVILTVKDLSGDDGQEEWRITRFLPKGFTPEQLRKFQFTAESLYSSTPLDSQEKIISYIRKWFSKASKLPVEKAGITDATAHIGVDSIAFKNAGFARVNSVEINPVTYKALVNNLRLFGVKERHIENYVVNDNYLDVYKNFKQHIIYIDAPWGGKDIMTEEDVELKLGDKNLNDFAMELLSETSIRLLVLKVPPGYKFRELPKKLRGKYSAEDKKISTKSGKVKFRVIGYYRSE